MGKLHEIKLEIDINASKEAIWETSFTKFGEVNNFNPLILSSHDIGDVRNQVGAERACEISAGKFIKEKITSSVGTESFKVDIIEGGLPMMGEMNAAFNLNALDPNNTNVQVSLFVSTKPAAMIHVMKGMMKAQFFDLLIGLKYHLETGMLVTKQNMGTIRKRYKAEAANNECKRELEIA
ncbi:hypothetical protein OAA53_02340 [Salibacteraceae bacterium]|nr:hypothetical protein [Flavobacteriales bacterium]MDB9701554.1 hypothetical protein [Salibacteraceae bacterium]